MHEEFPESLLHAFIDGQLHGRERERLLTAMESDPVLAERVCALQRTKAWVTMAFEDARASQRPLPRAGAGHRWIRVFGLAASLLLLASGFLLGWLSATAPEPLQSVVLRDIEAGHQKVLLHIDRADPERFDEILDGAEHLLRAYRDQGIAVDVLANAGGVDMLRADISPYADRIARMLREYDNLQFVACTNTLRRLKEKGVTPVLVEHTQQDATAVGHIIRRLQQGWTYIRV